MSQCTINTIYESIKGNATSYRVNKDKTEIFVPSSKFGSQRAYEIAKRMHDKATKLFGAYGRNTSLNTTYSDGTAVNIHPTKALDTAYDVKAGTKPPTALRMDDIRPKGFYNNDFALERQEKENLEEQTSFDKQADIERNNKNLSKRELKDKELAKRTTVRPLNEENSTPNEIDPEIVEDNEDLTSSNPVQEIDNELNTKFEQLLSEGVISQVCR